MISCITLNMLFMSHHLEALSSAKGLIGFSLWEMVFRSHVGAQLDGLLSHRLVGLVLLGLVLLVELLEQ